MSPVFDCTSIDSAPEGVRHAAQALRAGDLVVLPTDTVYGVAADAFNHKAVTNLLATKGRGRSMPPPVLVGTLETIDGLAMDVPDYVRAAVAEFWPGPLTLILKAQPSLTWDLGETNGTVALRMPDHPVTLALLREVGPLAVSSANRSGWPAPRTVLDAAAQLGAAVQVYLDGGPAEGGLASTIVDCTTDDPVIVRQGPISAEALIRFHPASAQSDGAAGEDDSVAQVQDLELPTDGGPIDPDQPGETTP